MPACRLPPGPAARCSWPSTATRRSAVPPRPSSAGSGQTRSPRRWRAGRPGLAEAGLRCYTSACVAASTAVADAAAIIARGRADRIVVAAGYVVESDQFALFDAGRVLADDGQVRPFSTGRRGLLLGDALARSSSV